MIKSNYFSGLTDINIKIKRIKSYYII